MLENQDYFNLTVLVQLIQQDIVDMKYLLTRP